MAELKTIKVIGPLGPVVINETDLEDYLSKGYKIASDNDSGANETELENMKLPELKAFAETNSIDLGEATKKADIVECIKERLTDPVFDDGNSDEYE